MIAMLSPVDLAHSLLEYGFLLKFVELNGRHAPYEPWSLRQLGCYHQYNLLCNESVYVLVVPTVPSRSVAVSRCKKWFGSITNATDLPHQSARFGELLFHTYMDSWREWMYYYESYLDNLVG